MIIGTPAACERYYALGGRVWSYLFCFWGLFKRGEIYKDEKKSRTSR